MNGCLKQTVTTHDSGNNITARRIFGTGQDPLARITISGAVAAWYLADRIGTVRHMTDNTGTINNAIDYTGFGFILSETAPTIGDRFKFAQGELDQSIGWQLHDARWYAPDFGSFTSQDPERFNAGDYNLHRYVGNDPISKIDPEGLGEQWHHLLPKQWFDPKSPKAIKAVTKLGIDINAMEFGLEIDSKYHSQLHPEWNKKWKRWIKAEIEAGRKIDEKAVRKQLDHMMYTDPDFKDVIAKGKISDKTYWQWGKRNALAAKSKLAKAARLGKKVLPVVATVSALQAFKSNVQAKGFERAVLNAALDALPGIQHIKAMAEISTGEDLIPDLPKPPPVEEGPKAELSRLTFRLANRIWQYEDPDGNIRELHGANVVRTRKLPADLQAHALIHDNLTDTWRPYDPQVWAELFYPDEIAKKLLGYQHEIPKK